MSDLRKHVDRFKTTLSSGISNSTLSIPVVSDSGFPSLTGSQYVILTITDGTNVEHVKTTSTSSNTLTVASGGRGAEGTSAQSWSSGASISCNTTSDSHDRKQQDLDIAVPSTVTLDNADFVLIKDNSDSGKLKQVAATDFSGGGGGGISDGTYGQVTVSSGGTVWTIIDNVPFGGTAGIKIPAGNTEARPATDYNIRINTDTYHFEARVFGNWTPYIWDADLPTGLITKSGALTYAAATFGSNQLTYSAGLLSIADDAQMPGNGGITLPAGGNGSRGPNRFANIRGNTATGFIEYNDSSQWLALQPHLDTFTVTSATIAANDKILFKDTSNSDVLRYANASTIAALATGRLLSFQILTSGSSATCTINVNATAVLVEGIGGGGGGAGAPASTGNAAAGGGGGAGAYFRKYITSPSSTYTYTIGGGGAGGTAGKNNGTTGGTTSFGTLSAAGGAGGQAGGTVSSAGYSVPGGAGGTASNGDINMPGGPGGHANIAGATVTTVFSGGQGGNSYFGGGAAAPVGTDPATAESKVGINAPNNSGAGGSGAFSINTTTARAGGNGGSGLIIVWEFS